jgi:hypothetical protein
MGTIILVGLAAAYALVWALGSVSVTYRAQATVAETLPGNTGSAADAKRQVTHDQYDIGQTVYNGTTTPPFTTVAEFLLALTAGAVTIDLRNLIGTNGAVVDGNGLKVQMVRIKNLGANPMTFKVGASNGHTGIFSASNGQVVQPGGHVVVFSNDNGDDIDGTHKTWDVTGTGAQTAQVTILLG